MTRSCGVLAPIFCLPSKYGIGSLGKPSFEFVDFLKKSGQRFWQVLPVVQTGYGDSPYQTVADCSGNPYFIDLDVLKTKGLLTKDELNSAIDKNAKIDYAILYEKRYPLLKKAFQRFNLKDKNFVKFVDDKTVDGYATFMTIKSVYPNCWTEWEDGLKNIDTATVNAFVKDHYDEYLFWSWLQYEFISEWTKLKTYANKNGIKIIGDLSLYVAYDSVDVWTNRRNFLLDEDCKPVKVAGVPPDYFSAKGQLWGNPVYDYDYMKKDGYAWWKERLSRAMNMYDVVRIDHFRGLDRFWSIPYGDEDATRGEWVTADGYGILSSVDKERLIAEDLGVIDDGVRTLKKRLDLKGMKVLLFSFDGKEDNDYAPWNIESNSVTYTGTHDNDTLLGFLQGLDEDGFAFIKKEVKKYLTSLNIESELNSIDDVKEGIIDVAYAVKSELVILPVQDVLSLDNSYRINTPSETGCWTVRLNKDMFTKDVINKIKRRVFRFERN